MNTAAIADAATDTRGGVIALPVHLCRTDELKIITINTSICLCNMLTLTAPKQKAGPSFSKQTTLTVNVLNIEISNIQIYQYFFFKKCEKLYAKPFAFTFCMDIM